MGCGGYCKWEKIGGSGEKNGNQVGLVFRIDVDGKIWDSLQLICDRIVTVIDERRYI